MSEPREELPQDGIAKYDEQGELVSWCREGYHVVQEGQAVVDGQVWTVDRGVTLEGHSIIGVTLRPLPTPLPVVDEMTTTTIAKEGM